MLYPGLLADFLRRYFSFKGTFSRAQFWYYHFFVALWILIGRFVYQIHLAVERGEIGADPKDALFFQYLPYALWALSLWALLAIHARRWRALGRSGWLALLLLVPGVNLFVLLYLGFSKGSS